MDEHTVKFGGKPATVGDVIGLATNTVFGSEPRGSIIVTTIYLDPDYVIDHVFWQHAALLTHPGPSCSRQFAPLRAEARQAVEAYPSLTTVPSSTAYTS